MRLNLPQNPLQTETLHYQNIRPAPNPGAMLCIQEVTMKTSRIVLALVVTLAAALATESAFAWGHSRVRVGFYVGVPLMGYPYYYPPYYYPPYYPAPVVVQQQPTVYVDQQPAPQAQPQQPAGYRYYCNESRAYYPYVRECPGGWQRVAPHPG